MAEILADQTDVLYPRKYCSFSRLCESHGSMGHLAQHLHIPSLKEFMDMVSNLSKLEEVNVLASGADWAWPEALRRIFRPRGVNLLVAENATEFVNVIRRRRIHTTIVDMDSEHSNGLATIKIIRMEYPLLPCILLSRTPGRELLGEALRLDVFSVIGKPVDMRILLGLLNRLFVKKYGSSIFESAAAHGQQ